MAGTVRTRSRARPHITLNSDGQSHPLLNARAFFTLIVGLVSFALGLVIRTRPERRRTAWAIVTAVTGLVALLVGLVRPDDVGDPRGAGRHRDRHHRGLRRPGASASPTAASGLSRPRDLAGAPRICSKA